MEGKNHPPTFFQQANKIDSSKIHLFPVCRQPRSQSHSSTLRIETPLNQKRAAQSPGEGTPTRRYPRLFSPVDNIQQELIEAFASDQDIIPSKTDLINMDLMSTDSIFKIGPEASYNKLESLQGVENPSIMGANNQREVVLSEDFTHFPFEVKSTAIDQVNCESDSGAKIDCQAPDSQLGLAAIIKLIKETVKEAIAPLKEEICLLKEVITKQNHNLLPQERTRCSTPPSVQINVPQVQQEQFASEDIRLNSQNSQVSKSPVYNSSLQNWGLPNQGRRAKSYSQTLMNNTKISKSLVPNLQPTPAMSIPVVNKPAYDLTDVVWDSTPSPLKIWERLEGSTKIMRMKKPSSRLMEKKA